MSTVKSAVPVPLVCPACRTPLDVAEGWTDGEQMCRGCGARYSRLGGIPRFVSSDAYAGNFSFEWLRHRRTQLDSSTSDESERVFRAKTGLSPEMVRGKLVLDAGCGMGRFADVVSRWGGQVVAVDISRAVEAAADNLAGRDSVTVCQADLRALPFPDESFDIIYSIGVLHHTPDCEAAFRGLVRYLAPGGIIAIWVYADDGGRWMKLTDGYRRVTRRLPKRLLYALCHVAIPWYYVTRLPVVGRLAWTLLPVSEHPKTQWRLLDTFDWYSPQYQSKHTAAEVCRWFASEGLRDIEVRQTPVAVSARKARLGETEAGPR